MTIEMAVALAAAGNLAESLSNDRILSAFVFVLQGLRLDYVSFVDFKRGVSAKARAHILHPFAH